MIKLPKAALKPAKLEELNAKYKAQHEAAQENLALLKKLLAAHNQEQKTNPSWGALGDLGALNEALKEALARVGFNQDEPDYSRFDRNGNKINPAK